MNQPTSQRPGVRSVSKALDVLRVLADSERELGLSELSRTLSMPKATTLRLVAALEEHGFVKKSPTATYALGLGLWELGRKAVDRCGAHFAARPWLAALVEETRETALFAVNDSQVIVYVDRVDSPLPIQLNPSSLGLSPFHASAAGKVFWAYLPHEVPKRSRSLRRYTANTIVDLASLSDELDAVRRSGWAASRREWKIEMSSLAAPVWDARARLAGAIVLSGPAERFTPAAERRFVPAVLRAARGASADLGYRSAGATSA